MSRQTELMAISESLTSKRFRFYLQNASAGTLLLRYAPGGWESAKFELKRNEKYWGLFRSISFNELKFLKDSRDYIRDVYEGQGVNANIVFTVQRWDDTTQAYAVYFTGKIDLSTYKIDETGVSCQVIDTQFAEKIKNRENTPVNLIELVSIEGFEIPPFTTEPPTFKLPAYNINGVAAWGINTPVTTDDSSHFVPMLLGTSDYTEAGSQTIAGTDPFFTSTAAHTFTISGTIEGIVICNEMAVSVTVNVYLKKNGIVEAALINASDSDVADLPFGGSFSEDVTIADTDTLSIETAVTGAVSDPSVEYYVVTVALNENLTAILASGAIGFPIYEAFLRCCQLIADSNDVFKSDKFGRTDTPITTYDTDGQFGIVTKGLLIRQSNGLNPTLPVTFVDLFKTFSSIFCLGMGIESGKVVIEDLRYFFEDTVSIDLSSRIQEATIGKEVMPSHIYNRLTSGYNTYEYEQQGGLSEYNTKSEYATVISALDNNLDVVSKYRGDTQGVIKLRQSFQESDDVKGDENIFVLDVVRDLVSTWLVRTDEDFDLVTGGIDAGQNYNLDWTPSRMVRRWGAVIRAGLEKNLGTYLKWQTSDKNTTLSTQLNTESVPVVENADILINNLTAPWFLPEIYTFEVEMRYSDLSVILANQKGLIKIAEDKYGWIMSLTIGEKENKADIRLLRANLNVVTPA